MTTETIPSYVKTFTCTKVTSGAVTYHLRPKTDQALAGWALATVNDATGELAIQSDWGNWSYRWNTNSLGDDTATLTHFISDRGSGHYLADKLTSRQEREHFDADKTVDHMQRDLVKARVAWARDLIEYYEDEPDRVAVWDDDPPRIFHTQKVWCRALHVHEQWPLTRQVTRTIYDALEELRGEDNEERFTEEFIKIAGHEIISTEPWYGDLQHTPSPPYMQLLHGILPALIEACFRRVHPGRHRCTLTMPREAGAGHWREWHRGHGCHLDDTPTVEPILMLGSEVIA